jgi:uncharacterized FlaG/YvyC family protein
VASVTATQTERLRTLSNGGVEPKSEEYVAFLADIEARARLGTNSGANSEIATNGDSVVVELLDADEAYEEIPESTKQEWEEMRETIRKDERRRQREANELLETVRKMNNDNRRVTRSVTFGPPQEIITCQLCMVSGDETTYGEYINGIPGEPICSLGHPMCGNCIYGLWKTPGLYEEGEDGPLMGRRIRFTKGQLRCPFCMHFTHYISRKTGQPIHFMGKSVIHGVMQWNNNLNAEDRMYRYIAGSGMEDVWNGMVDIFSHNYRNRPRGRLLVERELEQMFGERTFCCTFCQENKPMMERLAHTNGVQNEVDGTERRCMLEICKKCLGNVTVLSYRRRRGYIEFRCPSCVSATEASRPHFQEAPEWYRVKFLSTESDARYGGPRSMRLD